MDSDQAAVPKHSHRKLAPDKVKAGLEFIMVSSPGEAVPAETRTRVRRHVMRDIGNARRRPKKKRGVTKIPLEFFTPQISTASTVENERTFDWTICRLGVGELDPFLPFPIEIDDSARKSLIYFFREKSSTNSDFRNIWFPIVLADPASFHQMLSNAAAQLHKRQKINGNGNDSDKESMQHHVLAIQSVNKRLRDPVEQTSDGVISAVIGFLCRDLILESIASWNMHMTGLKEIIKLRGGIQAIEGNEKLRDTITWVDVCGSFGQDTKPNFPPSKAWKICLNIPSSPTTATRNLSPIPVHLRNEFPERPDFPRFFELLEEHTRRIAEISTREGVYIWRSSTYSARWTIPLIHEFLALRPLESPAFSPGANVTAQSGHYRGAVIEEVARLGCLLFISALWRKLEVHPIKTEPLTRKLHGILEEHAGVKWGSLKPLLTWTLYIAVLESTGKPNVVVERGDLSNMLVSLMRMENTVDWEAVRIAVGDVGLVVDGLFEEANFEKEIMENLGQLPLQC